MGWGKKSLTLPPKGYSRNLHSEMGSEENCVEHGENFPSETLELCDFFLTPSPFLPCSSFEGFPKTSPLATEQPTAVEDIGADVVQLHQLPRYPGPPIVSSWQVTNLPVIFCTNVLFSNPVECIWDRLSPPMACLVEVLTTRLSRMKSLPCPIYRNIVQGRPAPPLQNLLLLMRQLPLLNRIIL